MGATAIGDSRNLQAHIMEDWSRMGPRLYNQRPMEGGVFLVGGFTIFAGRTREFFTLTFSDKQIKKQLLSGHRPEVGGTVNPFSNMVIISCL